MSTDVTPSESLSAQVVEEILALMGRRRFNKAEMARRLGQSEVWIGRRLNGRLPLDLDDLAKIAVVLGVGVSDLLPKTNTVWKTRPVLGERVVATVGEERKLRARPRIHRPGRPVRQTRPVGSPARPVTAVAAGR